MLSPDQIKRLLKHCENIEEEWSKIHPMAGLENIDRHINIGWIQALRLVNGEDTYPISDSYPIKNKPTDKFDDK
tara:strand:- start:166 stop:387 length:222 start_codon:yes stop_codon:yes gene_type:complete